MASLAVVGCTVYVLMGLRMVPAVSVQAGSVSYHTEPYSKLRPGRHVCTTEKEVNQPVKRFEAYRKPTYQNYAHRCQDKICRGVRVIYETAYRDVFEDRVPREVGYHCCPGWSQEPKTSYGCNTPVCSKPCQNAGTCVQPDQCVCPPGFTGQQCEIDIDECTDSMPCSQLCTNTLGSFKCACRTGYRLAPDLHTCHRKGRNKTLDGKFDVEILARKISKLEKLWRKSSKYELQTELSDSPSNDELQASFENLQKKFDTMSRYQHEQWTRLQQQMERLQPLCGRLDALERRLSQCGCKCKDQIFTKTYP